MPGTETLRLIIEARDKASAVLKSSTKSVEASAASIKRAGRNMMIGGLALAAGIGYAVKQATMFGKDLAFVSTMLDESTMKYMPAYRKGLLDMSIEMGESSSTLAVGLYNILSAGIDAGKGLEVLKVASRAAAAGMTDTSISAYAINAILNAYVMTADKAAEVSDMLFTVVKKGVLTFPQLANSIGTLLGFAKAANVPLEQLGAMIATVTKAGFSCEITMTALRGLFSMISRKAGPEATAIMEKYGIAQGSAAIRGKELFKTLEAVNRMSEEEVSLLFSNIRARAALNALVTGQANYYDALAAMEKKEGATAEALAKIQATLWFQMKRLGSVIKVLLITGGETLIPVIKKLTSFFIITLKVIREIPKPIKTLTMGFLSLAAVLLITGGGMMLVQGSFKGLLAMKAGLVAFSNVLAGAAGLSVATAFKTLGVSLWGLIKPLLIVGITIEATTRLIGAGQVAIGKLLIGVSKMPDWMLKMLFGFRANAKEARETAKEIGEYMVDLGRPSMVKGAFKQIFDWLKSLNFGEVMAAELGIPAEKAAEVVEKALGTVQDSIKETGDIIKGFTIEAINLPESLGLPSFLEVIQKVREQSEKMTSSIKSSFGSKLALAPAFGSGATSPGFRQLNVKMDIPLDYQRLPDSFLAVVERELGGFA